jgi:hypothetical protein
MSDVAPMLKVSTVTRVALWALVSAVNQLRSA